MMMTDDCPECDSSECVTDDDGDYYCRICGWTDYDDEGYPWGH